MNRPALADELSRIFITITAAAAIKRARLVKVLISRAALIDREDHMAPRRKERQFNINIAVSEIKISVGDEYSALPRALYSLLLLRGSE